MIKMDDLKKIVKLVLITGNLKDYAPVSLLIVGKSGNGKTALITSFEKKSAVFVTDISYVGLLNMLKKDDKINHLIIPDFIKITQKKRSTSDNLISLLNALTEEGIGKLRVHLNEYDFKNKKIGLITATTKASFVQQKKQWEKFGFLQRMLIVSYDYEENTIEEILDSINKKEFLKEFKEKMKHNKGKINTNPIFNKQLNKIALRNFRTLKHLQALCEAHALLRGDREVKQEDIEEIIRLSKYMNLKFTKI